MADQQPSSSYRALPCLTADDFPKEVGVSPAPSASPWNRPGANLSREVPGGDNVEGRASATATATAAWVGAHCAPPIIPSRVGGRIGLARCSILRGVLMSHTRDGGCCRYCERAWRQSIRYCTYVLRTVRPYVLYARSTTWASLHKRGRRYDILSSYATEQHLETHLEALHQLMAKTWSSRHHTDRPPPSFVRYCTVRVRLHSLAFCPQRADDHVADAGPNATLVDLLPFLASREAARRHTYRLRCFWC